MFSISEITRAKLKKAKTPQTEIWQSMSETVFVVLRTTPCPFIQQEIKLCWQILDALLFWTWQHESISRVTLKF